MLNSAFEENPPREKKVLVRCINSRDDAMDEVEMRVLGEVQKTEIANNIRKFSFLCKHIKYKIFVERKGVCYYNSNQEMFYDFDLCACVYFKFNCELTDGNKSDEECLEKAMGYLKEAFVKNDVDVIECEINHKDLKSITFSFKTNLFAKIPITVTIRRDHGTLIYFDATDAAEQVVN